MTENTPSPQSGGATCPNCGLAQSASVAYCANCGAPLPPAKSSNGLSLVFKIIVPIMLFVGALGVGAFGACLLMLGGTGGGSGATAANSGANFYFVIAGLMAVAGVAWVAFWLLRKRRV